MIELMRTERHNGALSYTSICVREAGL